MDIAALERGLRDPLWRYDNLYTVETKDGRIEPFRMNWAQRELAESAHPLLIILKARQLGFTTFIQIVMLDAMIFHAHTNCGVIAHTKDDATKIFQKKIRDVYDRLHESIRGIAPAKQDAAKSMAFENGSSITVGTSLRGGTLQYLHVSEFGKIAATRPDKAREIRTGALNTIQVGQVAFIESTAEGQGGDFFDMVQVARDKRTMGRELGPLDWMFHFFPWWKEPGYVLDPRFVVISPELERYFDALEDEHGIVLTDWQAAWYAAKHQDQRDDMKREYPSTPDEAFEASIEGAYYSSELNLARRQGRIGDWPYQPKLGQVYSFEDIGRNDKHTIWLAQRDAGMWRFFHYYENQHHSAPHYARYKKDWADENDAIFGAHLLPHDGGNTDWSAAANRKEVYESLGCKPTQIVPRTKDVTADIQDVRFFIGQCKFDQAGCALGLQHLRNYRKDWNEQLGVFRDYPRHDDASHGADGFRTAAMADKAGLLDEEYYGEDDEREERQRGANPITGY